MLNPADFKQAFQTIDTLGATPAVLLKVIKLANDPNSDMGSVNALLRNDGPLVADIIRISNSPYYAPATPHSNLNSALNQMGLNEVIRMVNLSLGRQIFARDLLSYGISAYDYWSAAVATALVMESLAKKTGLNSEDAYTLGILHALGRVLIDRVIEEKGFSIYWDTKQPIQDWEREAVGFDFAEAGAMLLEYWHFPESMCSVLRQQLAQESMDEKVSLLGALQFTRRLLALTEFDFGNEKWELPINDPFIPLAGLTPESTVELVATCRESFRHLLQTVDFK